jgi:hypothetical protein
VLSLVLAGGAALIVASTIRMIVDCAVPSPIQDQWAQLVGLRSVTLSWLFSQHNEHRLLFPRLVFVADRWLVAETGAFSLGVSCGLQVGLVGLLAMLGWRARIQPGAPLIAAMAGVGGLLFWAVQYENQTWPFQVQFYAVVLTATGCFAAVASRATMANTAVAAALGFVAAFSLASGVMVPILAVALALWLRQPARNVAALVLAASGTFAAYLWGYQTPQGHTDPVHAITDPIGLIAYVGAELGAPFGNALRQLDRQPHMAAAIVIGGLGCAGWVACAWAVHRRPARNSGGLEHHPVERDQPSKTSSSIKGLGLSSDPRRSQKALVMTAAFVLAMTGLTAIGRLDFGVASAAASRYTTTSLLFWVCLLLLATALMPRAQGWAALATAALLGLAGLTQSRFVALAGVIAGDRALALPAIAAGVADTSLIRPIYPDAALPLFMGPTELSTRTGVFSQPWAQWIGTPLRDHVPITPAGQCAGRFSRATRIADPTYPGWRVEGTVSAPSRKRRSLIVLTGPDGRVRGYGVGDAGTTTLEASGPAGAPAGNGWAGALATVPPTSATAFVLLDHNTAACPLENAPEVVSPVMAELAGPAPPATPPGGAVDAINISDFVEVNGWALIQSTVGAPRLLIDTNLPIHTLTVTTVARPDAAAAMHDSRLDRAGFHIIMTLDPERPIPARPLVCLWSEDLVYGSHRLSSAPAPSGVGLACPG